MAKKASPAKFGFRSWNVCWWLTCTCD